MITKLTGLVLNAKLEIRLNLMLTQKVAYLNQKDIIYVEIK